jgi:hypothetical protein
MRMECYKSVKHMRLLLAEATDQPKRMVARCRLMSDCLQ